MIMFRKDGGPARLVAGPAHGFSAYAAPCGGSGSTCMRVASMRSTFLTLIFTRLSSRSWRLGGCPAGESEAIHADQPINSPMQMLNRARRLPDPPRKGALDQARAPKGRPERAAGPGFPGAPRGVRDARAARHRYAKGPSEAAPKGGPIRRRAR